MTTELPIVTQADVEAMRACQTDLLIAGAQGGENAWRRAEQAFAAHRIASNTEAATLIEEIAEALRSLEALAGRVEAGAKEGVLQDSIARIPWEDLNMMFVSIRALAKATTHER